MPRTMRGVMLVGAAAWMCACEAPTDPDEVSDLVEVTVSPSPAVATGPTGRTYVVQRDDRPDEIREYDWRTTFTLRVSLTEDADDEDLDVDFPVRITSATVRVQQATGGIVTPPTGTEVERYEFVSQASSNSFAAVASTVSMTFEAWYDNPNLRREALITVTLAFQDDEDDTTFSEVVEVQVAP